MKVALAQMNCHIGNFESNTAKIIGMIKNARENGAELVVFPELAVCGYPPLDFLDYNHFADKCKQAIDSIAAVCRDIVAIVGAPSVNPVLSGKNLYNSAFILGDGTVLDIVHKSLLPTYDVFDEYRYFEQGTSAGIIAVSGKKIAVTICEDLWNEEDDPMYIFCPLDKVIDSKPELIINIAASPFDIQQETKRKNILTRNVAKYQLPVVYVNHIGAQTDIIFDGGSFVMDASGKIVHSLPFFEESLSLFDFDTPSSGTIASPMHDEEKIHRALVCGIRDYFQKLNFKKAILGLSGGIDSALVLALAAEALGPENVLGVLMPSEFSTSHSISDAMQLAEQLGTPFYQIPINDIFEQYVSTTKQVFKDLPFDLTEENLQARIRGTLLMALSNKFGHILLNTSNKSELAVGFGTLYGDMCGGLSVIGDLYKTDVYRQCHYINRNSEIIPEHILIKAPSAELSHNQKDSDRLPPYELLDQVLFEYIENQKGPDEIIKMGFDPELVYTTLKLVNINEFKRFQFAPILRVSPKAFGRGRRMPLVAKYLI